MIGSTKTEKCLDEQFGDQLFVKIFALSIFDLVGLLLPTTKKFNFFESEPKTFPPLSSTIDFASDRLIFSNPPVNIIVFPLNLPFLFNAFEFSTFKNLIKFKIISLFFLLEKKSSSDFI